MLTDKKYRYAFIDAQFVLYRNHAILESNGTRVTPQLLVKMFTYSIMKFRREICEFGKPILCWDVRASGVYDKANALPGYKDDRNNPINSWSKALYEYERIKEPTKSDIENVLALRQEYEKYKIRETAKDFIIRYFHYLGVNSLAIPGVEADDFACLLSEIAKEYEEPSILITVDGDWKFLAYKNIDFYHTKRNIIYDYNGVQDMVEWSELDLYEQKIYDEVFKHSHNNVSNPLSNLPPDHPLRNYNHVLELAEKGGRDAILAEVPEEFRKATSMAIEALDIRKNRKDLIPAVKDALYKGTICYGSVEAINNGHFNYHDSRFENFYIGVPMDKIENFVRGLNPDLYEGVSYENVSKNTVEDFFGGDKDLKI